MEGKLCWQYERTGTCSYGASCKFSHGGGQDMSGKTKIWGKRGKKPGKATTVQTPSTVAARWGTLPSAPPPPLYVSDSGRLPAWGETSGPTTFAPYPHHVYAPNDYIAAKHPDFVYTPKNAVQYTQDRALALETPLDDFFASFSSFKYNPYASVSDEYSRLRSECFPRASFFRADAGMCEIARRAALRGAALWYKRALVDQFKVIFGVERNSLRAWQTLYAALDVDPLPSTLNDCYQLINGIFVNMVDVLDSIRINRLDVNYKVPVFPTEKELSSYTKQRNRYFPLGDAYESGLLARLLRYIESPREPGCHAKPSESLNMQKREILSRLAAAKVVRMNATNLEVAMAKDALARLSI